MPLCRLLLAAIAALSQEATSELNVVGVIPLPGDVVEEQIVFFFDKPLTPEVNGRPLRL